MSIVDTKIFTQAVVANSSFFLSMCTADQQRIKTLSCAGIMYMSVTQLPFLDEPPVALRVSIVH
jgi:hypothetical protein